MALAQSLKIHKECMKLLNEVDNAYTNMKRMYRFVYGDYMVKRVLRVMECIGEANRSDYEGRVECLNEALMHLDNVDSVNTHCHNKKDVMADGICEQIAHKVKDVSKQAVGWRRDAIERMKGERHK